MSLFSTIKVPRVKRNAFRLDHTVKMSAQFGYLYPIMCQDVVPGDSFRCSSEVFLRMAPMIAPIMHNVNAYVHYFFVPNRLVWDEWEDFITGGEDGSLSPVFPQIQHTGIRIGEGSLGDYLGFPTSAPLGDHISALPFRAYQLIYNDYYRDQNLTPEVEIDKSSGVFPLDQGGPVSNIMQLRRRCFEKDYFTAALPFTQRGAEVHLPVSGDASVIYDPSGSPDDIRDVNGNVVGADGALLNDDGWLTKGTGSPTDPITRLNLDNSANLKADMSSVTATTINDLRRAVRLQQWLERNARGGARYIEQILSHFGVRSSDARLQRPEFLGGGRVRVNISEVLQTSSSDDVSPQANMSGHGVALGKNNFFKRSFEEHGQIIALLSIRPRTAYQQGVPRQFRKFDKFDYFYPEFANLGEQPVYNYEVYEDNDSRNMETFGYQPRYAEYKYIPDRVAGKLRSSLNFWHLGRIFANRPVLNENFVTVKPEDQTRIFAVGTPDSEQFYCQIINRVTAIRPMPRFGTPIL